MNCHMCGCELIEATASTVEQWYGMAPHDHVQDEYGWTWTISIPPDILNAVRAHKQAA